MASPKQKKSLSDLRRSSGSIIPAQSVLIVCEGEKTEPIYFSSFVEKYNLITVEVVPAKGSAPVSIVSDAAERKKERRNRSKGSVKLVPYDHVYCVFDVDEHPDIPSALETARQNKIQVALSNPCFEYWLLLHFDHVGSTGLTRKRAVQELEKKLGQYKKGADYRERWLANVDRAIQNADTHHRSQWQIDPTDPKKILNCCPSTGVHILVKLLIQIGSLTRES